jgi:hypothetical protein
MTDLTGKFYFTANIGDMDLDGINAAHDIAAQMNELKDLNKNLKNLQWRPFETDDGSWGVSAHINRIRTGLLAGDWLKEKGIVTDLFVIENRPSEKEEVEEGKDRHYEIAVYLLHIDDERLKETTTEAASRLVMSAVFPERTQALN